MTERPNKHTTIRDGKRLLWYAAHLWELARNLEPYDVALETIAELDKNCWFDRREPTLREVTRHLKRVMQVDDQYPIILNADGSLMDGGHRVCRALLAGRTHIKAVRFPFTPEPDEISEAPVGP